jgi:hypothetical protein
MEFIGFDPGGVARFGWAVLSVGARKSILRVKSGTCGNAIEAISRVEEALDGKPDAVGIDAPLYWTPSTDRHADRVIRRRVIDAGGHGGTVNHVNALQGACLVQGVVAAREAAKKWRGIAITESHPKALLLICPSLNTFLEKHSPSTASQHERDALIAAYSAWSYSLKWPDWHNLVSDEDGDVFWPSSYKAAYWFPS